MRQSPLPSGTVTFLFTDIEGSTKLWEADPAAMRLALARHDALMRQAITNNGGFVFKTIGDAFCAAFTTAPEAVAAALEAQLSLFAEPWLVEPPVRARMALHTGTAQERDSDYFGQPVNRVARLLSAAHGGQTLVSLVTQELIRDSLPPFVSLTDLGDASLKDLARPERVYQLQHAQIPSEFPPLRVLSSAALPNNLPQQPTSFIGREKELADVTSLLTDSRLLTLVGAGGSGKTRLALQAAADLVDTVEDGVWLVELASLTDPMLVPGEVAQAVGIKEADQQSTQSALAHALKSKSLLIVLDNCEHLIAACATLASELLRNCPNVKLLATSREPLRVPGEQVYRVPSLSVPGLGADGVSKDGVRGAATAESLSQYDSVRLFVDRAKAALPAFAVTDSNAAAVAQICYHLDGIPLAVELAAARVRSLPVEQVNARLDHRFRLLTGGARTLLPRQQTLRALIDWSYDLLTEPEKAMFCALSIFSGGWALDAAVELVLADELGDAEEWEALDLLASLTDKSLVSYQEHQEGSGAARYRMLESIREYSQEKLAESGNHDALARRHRDWCLALAEEANTHISNTMSTEWLQRLEAELDNMRAALAWCEQQAADEAFPGLRIAVALANFWRTRGYLREGRHWLEALLPLTEIVPAGDDFRPLRATAYNAAGSLAYSQGDFAAAMAFDEQGLEIARALGDKRRIANLLNNIGNIAYARRDYPAAARYYEESLELRREDGLPHGTAGALGNLGMVKVDQGELAAAQPLLQESLDIMRRLGDLQGIAVSLNNLAELAVEEGNHSAARALYQESLDIARQIGDKRRIANALHNVGKAIFDRDDAEAAAIFRESLQLRTEIGEQSGIAELLERLAETALAQAQPQRAIRLWSAAEALRDELGTSPSEADQQQCLTGTDRARLILGNQAVESAIAAGRAMGWQQAVHYALSNTENV